MQEFNLSEYRNQRSKTVEVPTDEFGTFTLRRVKADSIAPILAMLNRAPDVKVNVIEVAAACLSATLAGDERIDQGTAMEIIMDTGATNSPLIEPSIRLAGLKHLLKRSGSDDQDGENPPDFT